MVPLVIPAATCKAPATAAPLDMPTKSPSRAASIPGNGERNLVLDGDLLVKNSRLVYFRDDRLPHVFQSLDLVAEPRFDPTIPPPAYAREGIGLPPSVSRKSPSPRQMHRHGRLPGAGSPGPVVS